MKDLTLFKEIILSVIAFLTDTKIAYANGERTGEHAIIIARKIGNLHTFSNHETIVESVELIQYLDEADLHEISDYIATHRQLSIERATILVNNTITTLKSVIALLTDLKTEFGK